MDWIDDTKITLILADKFHKQLVLALQSGLKSEVAWALNSLTVLSFRDKDDFRKTTTPLAKIPGILDALIQVVSFSAGFAPSTRIRCKELTT